MVFESPDLSFKVTLYVAARTLKEPVDLTDRDGRPLNVFVTGEALSATVLTDIDAHADAILAHVSCLDTDTQRRVTGWLGVESYKRICPNLILMVWGWM